MGFLDNSGDIILDAVLTDTGRYRLAKGDGTFRIAKFALGDDEINYSLYNQSHSSGSAYYDLEILQSPVLEAFTNNTSLMKSKLISIPRTNLLYLPTIKVKETGDSSYFNGAGLSNLYIITVDQATEGDPTSADTSSDTAFRSSTEIFGARGSTSGILAGLRPSAVGHKNHIEVHQGLDTRDIPSNFTIDSDLKESQYIIEMDSRLGSIMSSTGGETAPVSFIDDDHIASYFISRATGANFIADVASNDTSSPVLGPRGTKLMFKIKSSTQLSTSTFLFTRLGSTMAADGGVGVRNFRFIDSTIRITGATTGYRIDIPVRFVKSTT